MRSKSGTFHNASQSAPGLSSEHLLESQRRGFCLKFVDVKYFAATSPPSSPLSPSNGELDRLQKKVHASALSTVVSMQANQHCSGNQYSIAQELPPSASEGERGGGGGELTT